MLLEDLADRTGSAEYVDVEATHAIGGELLTLVDDALGRAHPDALRHRRCSWRFAPAWRLDPPPG